MKEKRKISRMFLILAILIMTDMIGYIIIEKANLIDAFYMTIISITTVGFKEVFQLSTAGKIFTMFVIITGLGVVFYIAETFVENTVEGRIRKIFGRRKMVKNIAKMKKHVILAGFGKMGEEIAREFKSKTKDFIIIEQSPERFMEAEERGFNIIQGDATNEEILKTAGIDQAKAFISLLSSDADNIFTVMTARELKPNLLIITRAYDSANEKKLTRVGANMVVSPYSLGASRIVNTVIKPHVVDFMDNVIRSPNISLSFEEITISRTSPLIGKKIRDAGLREQYNAIVVGIKRDDKMLFNPSPELDFKKCDILILLGEREKLKEMK